MGACSSSASQSTAVDSDATDVVTMEAALDSSRDAFADAIIAVDSARDSFADAQVSEAMASEAATDASTNIDAGETAISCSVSSVEGVCIDTSQCTGVHTAGYCPGPANIQCCTASRPPSDAGEAGWCPTNPAALPNAGLVEAPGVGGCPAGMVLVSDYCASAPDSRNNVDISAATGGARASGTYGVAFCIDRYESSI